jgi:hypothetical protein
MATGKKILIDIELVPSKEQFDKLTKDLDNIKKRLDETKKASDTTSQSMSNGFKAGSDAAALIPGPIGQAATAVGGLKSSFDAVRASLVGVRIALVATGIGAFVVIVGTLVAYFANTEKGAQSLRVAMAGLGAIVSNLVDAWLGLAKATIAFWTLDFKGGAENLKQALNSATTGLVNNTAAAIKNAKALNDVEVAEGDLTVARSKANMEITRARLIADDLKKSTEERIEAVKRAAQIEREVAAEELRIAQIKAKALKEGVDNKVDADEEERDIADQAAARVYDLQSETLRREKRLGSEIQSLRNEQATKDKEADAARLAKIKEKNDAEIELAKKLAEEKKAAEEAAIKAAEKRIENQDKIDEYISERKAVTAEEELQLDIDRAKNAEKKKYEAVVAAITENQANEQLRKQELDAAKLLYEQEQMVIANDLTAAFNEKKLSDAEKLEADLLKVQQDANAKKVEEEKKVKQARLMVAGQVANGLGAIGQLITTAQGEQTAASKAFAIGQLAINTAMSISEAIAGATTSATATGPGAFVATPLFIATSIATVLASVAQATAILSSAPGGGSVSTPTASSVGATSAPSFSPVTTNTTQLGNTQQAELAPVQAYVVETQITGSQANINQIESQSTFGGG